MPPSEGLKFIQLVTDGSCLRNPGPGGWACILRFRNQKKEMFGSEPRTTNNRMELTAAVRGLSVLKEPCNVEVITDSQYLKNGVTTWMRRWKQNGWRTASKLPVLNQDLWEDLERLAQMHRTRWVWTKGHAFHDDNNRCDELASRAAREQSSSE